MKFEEFKFIEQKLFEPVEDAQFAHNRINFINSKMGELAIQRSKIDKQWNNLLAERVYLQINIERFFDNNG